MLELPGEPTNVSVDAVRLRQAVLALFQNAKHYGGPTIATQLRVTADDYFVTVDDDGPGLSPEEMRQAFDRFFRGSNASGEVTAGSGLGLPIVKSIVEAHGGDVQMLDSDMGGLCVELRLPRRPNIRAVDAPPELRRA